MNTMTGAELPPGVSVRGSTMCMPMHFLSGLKYFGSQMSLAMAVAVGVNLLLNPHGVPTYVCHLIAGFVMGPSVLAQLPYYRETFFPVSTSILLDSYADLALVFQLFLIGVQVNPSMILKAGKRAVSIGIFVIVVPVVLATSFALALTNALNLELHERKAIMSAAVLQSITTYPVIVFYIHEVNILRLEFSHVAYSSSIVSGVLSSLLAIATALYSTDHDAAYYFGTVTAHAFMAIFIFYVVRPCMNWIIRRVPDGEMVKEMYMGPVYLALMAVTLMCMLNEVNWMFGPFLFGVIIPARSTLGLTIVKRFEVFHMWTLMPVFYLSHGMKIDVWQLSTRAHLLTEFVIIVSYTGKFLGAFLPALFFNMTLKEAILLGLTMNVQGFIEVSQYRLQQKFGAIGVGAFQVISASMIFSTAIFTPLLGYLYRRSLNGESNGRGTQFAESNMALRVLACVYNQENVPSIIHLLKAINPTKHNPVNLSIVHFVERVGLATPSIINHKIQNQASSSTAGSQRIINVFKGFEDRNSERIFLSPYTVVSHYTSLPNDLCTLAEQQRTSLIILPYHKALTTGILNPDLRTVNCEVLDKANCSVGILIDRGLLGGIKFVHENLPAYHVAVIFIGGADDREAVAQAARMSTHPNIELTVVRVLSDYPNPTYSVQTEMSLDNEMIRGFKQAYEYHERIIFLEMEVQDEIALVKLLQSMEDRFELIILGRRHDRNLPLILGLTEWSECTEIGTIGDIVLTSNYGGKSTILIVQQHKNASHRPGSFVKDEDSTLQSFYDPQIHDDESPLQSENDKHPLRRSENDSDSSWYSDGSSS